MTHGRPFRPAGHTGRVISVIGTKGGCGGTTVATNLATALALSGRSVCLVDLDTVAGDAAAVLGLEPPRSLADWQLDDEDAERNVARIATPSCFGLDCVAAPVAPGAGARMPVPVVEGALNTLSQHYDVVIVDIPSRPSPYAVRAMECSHEHVLVTTPEGPALRRLRQAQETMDLLGFDLHLRSIVFNRSDRRGARARVAAGDTVPLPLGAHVPRSADVAESINRCAPLVATHPAHPVSSAITAFAVALFPQSELAPAAAFAAVNLAPHQKPTGRGP